MLTITRIICCEVLMVDPGGGSGRLLPSCLDVGSLSALLTDKPAPMHACMHDGKAEEHPGAGILVSGSAQSQAAWGS